MRIVTDHEFILKSLNDKSRKAVSALGDENISMELCKNMLHHWQEALEEYNTFFLKTSFEMIAQTKE